MNVTRYMPFRCLWSRWFTLKSLNTFFLKNMFLKIWTDYYWNGIILALRYALRISPFLHLGSFYFWALALWRLVSFRSFSVSVSCFSYKQQWCYGFFLVFFSVRLRTFSFDYHTRVLFQNGNRDGTRTNAYTYPADWNVITIKPRVADSARGNSLTK